MKSEKSIRHLLVMLPTSTNTQRLLLKGLMAYSHIREGARWQFHLDLRDLNRQHLKNLRLWDCDGIIAYILSDRERREYLATGLPCVFVEPLLSKPLHHSRRNVVSFINAHADEGRTAAEYFLKRGYRNFAYIGTAKPTVWSRERLRGFVARLAREKLVPNVYPECSPAEQVDFGLESRRIVRWLKSLSEKTAVFCVHDRRAQQIIDVTFEADIPVPGKLAVLGVDNDELLCEMTSPTISSIPTEDEQMGRDVGRAMEALLNRRPFPRTIVTRHTSVITRRSSDMNAIADPFVARAINYAMEHLGERPTLTTLALQAGCSRTSLALRSKKEIGRPLAAEIRRLKVEKARELIANTDRTMSDIAAECGFCSASHLSTFLRTTET